MSQVLLFTPPFFRGTITATPSGTAYHVKPGETVVANASDESFLIGLGFSSAAPPANPGTSLTVTDGVHSVTNASTIDFTSGGAVTDLGGGTAGVSISGGGGGSVTAGLGIYVTGDTVGNTGTIVQPSGTGTLGVYILQKAGSVHFDGTYVANAGAFKQYGGNATITNPAATGIGGEIELGSGGAYYASALGFGIYLTMTGAKQSAGTASGGGLYLKAGGAYSNVTNEGGTLAFIAGSAADKGGDITINPGTGAANGVLLVANIGTSDPHVLNAKFQVSVASVGYVGVYSKG